MSKAAFKAADINLAEFGLREIIFVGKEMPRFIDLWAKYVEDKNPQGC